MTVRIELEKDIKLLQEELAALKHENRQLRSDKEDVERQFIEYKIKSEDSITKLRGKLAAISMGICPVPNHLIVEDRHGGGRLYHNPPASHHGVNIPTIKPHQQSPHVFLRANSGTMTPSFSSPVAPTGFYPSPLGGIPYSSGENYTQLEGEGFRDPTFSELMRRCGILLSLIYCINAFQRSTFEKPDFKDSLRRTGDKRIPVQQSAHNSASKLPSRNHVDNPQGSNGGGSGSNKILKSHVPVLTGRHHQQQYLHQNSFNSPHGKGSADYFSTGGNENKGNLGSNIHSSGGGSIDGTSNLGAGGGSSGINAATSAGASVIPRKTSKAIIDANVSLIEPSHHVIRTDGDDDDLEVVEIDLRH